MVVGGQEAIPPPPPQEKYDFGPRNMVQSGSHTSSLTTYINYIYYVFKYYLILRIPFLASTGSNSTCYLADVCADP